MSTWVAIAAALCAVLVGTAMIAAVLFVWITTGVLGLAGVVLAALGMCLIGFPIWGSIEFEAGKIRVNLSRLKSAPSTGVVGVLLISLASYQVYQGIALRKIGMPGGFAIEFGEPLSPTGDFAIEFRTPLSPQVALIRVDRAKYGVDGRFMDMTAFFQGECNGRDFCIWTGYPHLVVGDPYLGKPKHLTIQWRCDEENRSRVFQESQMAGGKTRIFLECR